MSSTVDVIYQAPNLYASWRLAGRMSSTVDVIYQAPNLNALWRLVGRMSSTVDVIYQAPNLKKCEEKEREDMSGDSVLLAAEFIVLGTKGGNLKSLRALVTARTLLNVAPSSILSGHPPLINVSSHCITTNSGHCCALSELYYLFCSPQ
ncbi:hypothetical protein J6590_097190 [Homalodisca vitripennis]|nr:hypothetical protein J6590_097190 [Homalodisca vitripennis]